MVNHFPFALITVVKDDEIGLARTRTSIESQTCRHWKHVIIYAESSDKTAEYALNLSGFPDTLVKPEEGSGIYAAMNQAIELIHGDYFLSFINAGDYLYQPDSLQKIAEKLQNQVAWLSGGFIHEDENGFLSSKITKPFKPENQLYAWKYHSHQSVFVHNSIVKQAGQFDLKYQVAADWDWMVRLSQITNPIYERNPRVVFALGGLSSDHIALAHKELRFLRKVYLQQNSLKLIVGNIWLRLVIRKASSRFRPRKAFVSDFLEIIKHIYIDAVHLGKSFLDFMFQYKASRLLVKPLNSIIIVPLHKLIFIVTLIRPSIHSFKFRTLLLKFLKIDP